MNCSKAELIEVIRGQVLPRKSTIYTEGWRAYDGLVMEGYKHHRINHHENEFARDRRHTESSASGATPNCAWQNFAAFAGNTSMTTSKKLNGASIIAVITFSISSSLISAPPQP
jgi:transposase-like protein